MVKIDFRKIIGFGNGSYVVTVPKTWINKNKLKKGDSLTINEGADELTFSINHEEQKKERKTITIEVDNKELTRVKAEIVSAYLNNYTTIEIISKKVLTKTIEIKNILRDLAGMEIMEQTARRITARDLINIYDISIENIIRRMDNITRGMMEDCIECINGIDYYESIFQRDTDVNRLHYLALRFINNALENPQVARKLKKEISSFFLDGLVIMRIEEVADRQKRIARYLKGTKLRKETVEELDSLYNEIKKAYYDVMKAYYTNNKELAFDVEFANKQLIYDSMSFLERNTGCYKNACFMMDEIKKNKGKNKIKITKPMVDLINKNLKQKEKGMTTYIQIAKIVENLNGINHLIKNIARRVMDGD